MSFNGMDAGAALLAVLGFRLRSVPNYPLLQLRSEFSTGLA